MEWSIDITKLPRYKDAILVEGLPGIGNVGKIVVDYIVQETKAKRILGFSSFSMPNSVFVNEDNLVDLPKMEIFHIRGKRDILLLTGDYQPVNEESAYLFCDKVLDVSKRMGVKTVVALGGIGLREAPLEPKIFCTGSSKKAVEKFPAISMVNKEVYGVGGPILGVAGLLLGLAKGRKADAIALLAETHGNPMYIGIPGALELLRVLNSAYGLGVKPENLQKELDELDKELKENPEEVPEKSKLLKGILKKNETSYIG